MESLPGTQRDALVLHYWQVRSNPEIAELMDRTPSAIAGLLHRGLKTLREELADLE